MKGKDGLYIWRQDTPAMQLVSLNQRMWGDFDNWAMDIVNDAEYERRNNNSFEEMHELIRIIRIDSAKWPNGSRSSESL